MFASPLTPLVIYAMSRAVVLGGYAIGGVVVPPNIVLLLDFGWSLMTLL